MSSVTKVTQDERNEIVDLLKYYPPRGVSTLTGRGIRTVYYIQAEERKRQAEHTSYSPFERLKKAVKETINGKRKETITCRKRKARGSEI